MISCSYEHLVEVKVGQTILIADGNIVCEVLEIFDKAVKVLVKNNAKLEEKKNMNLPGVVVKLPTLIDQDIEDLQKF